MRMTVPVLAFRPLMKVPLHVKIRAKKSNYSANIITTYLLNLIIIK